MRADYFPEGAFCLPDVVSIVYVLRFVMYIINLELQILLLLKMEVKDKVLHKVWVEVVPDDLGAPN